jgi:F0F1-type ATP synthase delta subunit
LAKFLSKNSIESVSRHVSFLTRVISEQKKMQKVWNSPYFNAVTVSLIVSSFSFTFNGVQNVDPEMDNFYERVDLIYTIIFAAGNC